MATKLRNPLQLAVAYPYVGKKPRSKDALREILNGLADASNGTAWNPVSGELNSGQTDIIYNQCPGACGHTWRFTIKDRDTANWIVNEINSIRHGTP